MRGLLALLLAAAAVAYAVGASLFLMREDDPIEAADAIVVLAGGLSRLPEALSLARRGAAPVLVVSEDPSGKDGARDSICDRGTVEGAELVCAQAVPYSTRGEARFVARLADERGWDRIAIVTSRYHLFRAKRLFERCTDAVLMMHGSNESVRRNVLAVPLEWTKVALAETFRRGC